jgi:hypothetical protein
MNAMEKKMKKLFLQALLSFLLVFSVQAATAPCEVTQKSKYRCDNHTYKTLFFYFNIKMNLRHVLRNECFNEGLPTVIFGDLHYTSRISGYEFCMSAICRL